MLSETSKTEIIHACSKCGETFRYSAMLDRHMWTHQNEDPGHKCSRDRSRCFMERLLQCDYCDKVLPCNLMSRHVRQIHFHESFSCVLCEQYNMTPETYAKHVFERHSSIERSEPRRSCSKCAEIQAIYGGCDSVQKFFCDYCILVQPYNACDNKRRRMMNGFQLFDCHLCQHAFTLEDSLKSHMRSHRAPRFICTYCHKVFVNKLMYEAHIKRHTEPSPARKINYSAEVSRLKALLTEPIKK